MEEVRRRNKLEVESGSKKGGNKEGNGNIVERGNTFTEDLVIDINTRVKT